MNFRKAVHKPFRIIKLENFPISKKDVELMKMKKVIGWTSNENFIVLDLKMYSILKTFYCNFSLFVQCLSMDNHSPQE